MWLINFQVPMLENYNRTLPWKPVGKLNKPQLYWFYLLNIVNAISHFHNKWTEDLQELTWQTGSLY